MKQMIMKHLDKIGWVAFVLLLVGGINMGLYGLFGADLLLKILGGFLGRLLFVLIGVSAGYLIYLVAVKKEKL